MALHNADRGWLRFARAAGGILIVSAASVSEAVHGRPSCVWMQRSVPHQRIASVSEARSASASRRSLALGKTKEMGWHVGRPLTGERGERKLGVDLVK